MVKIKNTYSKWGGDWTEKKLDAFIKYVKAYLAIMNSCKAKFGWEIIYFDGFAGSGEGNKKDNDNTNIANIFELPTDNENCENNIYQGSAERILGMGESGFDYIYFIEKDNESIERLKSKLEPYNIENVQFRQGDANEQIMKLAEAQNRNSKYASLVFLDPFGMEIKWESIEALKGVRSDVWILVPTGVIINRLLDKRGELKSIKKLESFFGLSEQEIKKYFYETKQRKTLFGDETIQEKISNAIPKIAELYIERLNTIWDYVTEKPLVLYNSNNVPIFHFVFASNNKNAKKIASQIIK